MTSTYACTLRRVPLAGRGPHFPFLDASTLPRPISGYPRHQMWVGSDTYRLMSRPVSIYPILSVNFVGTLGFSIVLPFLVFLVTRLGGNALVYGVMGATYSFFQLMGAPILGRMSDRYGRRRILLLSQLGTMVSWGVFLFALSLPVVPLMEVDSAVTGAFTVTVPILVLFFARALDGITGGNVSVANAYLADITEESERSTNLGKMAISGNLGFILGPALAGALGATAWGRDPTRGGGVGHLHRSEPPHRVQATRDHLRRAQDEPGAHHRS